MRKCAWRGLWPGHALQEPRQCVGQTYSWSPIADRGKFWRRVRNVIWDVVEPDPHRWWGSISQNRIWLVKTLLQRRHCTCIICDIRLSAPSRSLNLISHHLQTFHVSQAVAKSGREGRWSWYTIIQLQLSLHPFLLYSFPPSSAPRFTHHRAQQLVNFRYRKIQRAENSKGENSPAITNVDSILVKVYRSSPILSIFQQGYRFLKSNTNAQNQQISRNRNMRKVGGYATSTSDIAPCLFLAPFSLFIMAQ